MLNTNNNTIKNSNGVNKKLFNLIFISSLFLVLLTLFSVQTVKAYGVGDVVSFSFATTICSTGNSSQTIDWYGAPGYLERKIIPPCVNGEVPIISTIKITSPSGCKVNGCGADPSLECVTLKYSGLYTYTDSAREPIGLRNLRESCKKCHAEVVEVVEVPNDANGSWRRVKDILVTKNKCAKYKAGACATPCPDSLTCPVIEKDCVIENKNGDEDAEDEYDYKCVVEVATAAAPTAAAPITGGGLTAAPVAGEEPIGVVLAASTGSALDPGCKCLVDSGKSFWCPSEPLGCCPKDPIKYTCYFKDKEKRAVCCAPNQTGKTMKIPLKGEVNWCSDDSCKPDEKLCPGNRANTCCSKEKDGSGNDIYSCADFNGAAYCKKNICPVPQTTDECFGLCCKLGQKCAGGVASGGIHWCQPKDESQCDTAGGETFCPGEGSFENEKNRCCPSGQQCLHHPNGYPYCL